MRLLIWDEVEFKKGVGHRRRRRQLRQQARLAAERRAYERERLVKRIIRAGEIVAGDHRPISRDALRKLLDDPTIDSADAGIILPHFGQDSTVGL
jgi:hypothetical protein